MDRAWMKKYEAKRDLLRPTCANLGDYFVKPEIAGLPMAQLSMGQVYLPTGRIMALDPLVSMNRNMNPYFLEVPTGLFPLTTAVVSVGEGDYRYAATRLAFNGNKPLSWVNALEGNEDIGAARQGDYFGFRVDAGLATIVDVRTRDACCDFIEAWEREHPDANLYDDFFAEAFAANQVENPAYQREGGDWVNWRIPGTNLTVPMLQSGLGDGSYPAYFGFDEKGDICQFAIHFIDIQIELTGDPNVWWG